MNLEEGPKFHRKQVEAGVRLILQGLSIDALDPNFVDTPKRVTRSFREFCLGLYESKKKMEDILGKTFPCDKNELVVVGPVRSVGLCPHHLLPVTIITWFGYLPDNKVVGLSKIPRMIKLLSAKPVLQESLTSEIVDKFLAYTKALGAGVIVEAKHSCMTSRGVHEHDSSVMTAAVRGLFEENSSLKEEFYRLVEMKKEDPMR
jgi:GTP cyclohydrolase IA